MKSLEKMTDAELDAELNALKKPEEMSDEELNAELASQSSSAPKEKYNDLASFGAHAGNMATFDYGPNLLSAAKNLSFSSPEYIKDRDQYNKVLEEMDQEDPGYSLAGKVTGVIGPALIPVGAAAKTVGTAGQLAKEAGLGAKLLKATATGAAIGAAQDTPDVEGKAQNPFSEDELKRRGAQAATGAVVGPLAEGAGAAVKAVIPDKVAQGFKSLGPYKPQFKTARIAEEEGRLGTQKDIVDFARKEGILKPFSSAQDLYERTNAVRDVYKEELGSVYNRANDLIQKTTGSGLEKITPESLSKSITDEAREAFKYSANRDRAINEIQNYFSQFDNVENLSLLDLHKMKSALGKESDFAKSNRDLSSADKIWKFAERKVDNLIKNQVDTIAEKVGDPQISKALREANKGYSLSDKIYKTVANRIDAEGAEYQVSVGEILQNLSLAPRARSALSSIGSVAEKLPSVRPQLMSVPSAARAAGMLMAPKSPYEIDQEIKDDPSLTPSQKMELRKQNKKGR